MYRSSISWRLAGRHRQVTLTNSVCEENTNPDKKTLGSISLKSTESGGGKQFMLFLCKAEARRKGVAFVTDSGRKVTLTIAWL